MINGITQPKGMVSFKVTRKYKTVSNSNNAFVFIKNVFIEANPFAKNISPDVKNWRLRNFARIMKESRRIFVAKLFKIPHIIGELHITVIKANGEKIVYGLASLRVVTNAGVAFIVDAFQNTKEVENLKYHALGLNTGDPGEFATDVALTTELTTQYNPDSTRATGTTIEGASANIYRTVATNTLDQAAAIKEHGIFDQAAAGGTLLDRSVFAVINLGIGDGLESTYDLTFSAGG